MEQEKLELSEQLLRQLNNLVERNQGRSAEFTERKARVEYINIQLEVHWQFKTLKLDSYIPGGHRSEQHFTSSAEFDNHREKVYLEVKQNQQHKLEFLQQLAQKTQFGLTRGTGPQRLYNSPEFSITEYCYHCRSSGKIACGKCNSQGKTQCSSCRGKGVESCYVCRSGYITCIRCGGMGTVLTQEPEYRDGQVVGYYNKSSTCSSCSGRKQNMCYSCCGRGEKTCFSCSGQGETTCRSCNGRGEISCSDCQGHGYNTHYCHVNSIASAKYVFQNNAPEYQEELNLLLEQMGVEACIQKIDFQYQSQREVETDQYVFCYQGTIPWLRQDFKLKGQEYQCYALFNPPYTYIRPKIFDTLLADELNLLRTALPEKQKLNKKKAFEFFSRYSKQPIIEQTMHNTEEEPNTSKISDTIKTACDGFISDHIADQLGLYLSKIVGNISPSYSSKSWFTFTAISTIPSFLFFSMLAERYFYFDFNPILLLIFGIVVTLLIAVGTGIIASLTSTLLVRLKRRKIPKAYWQKIRNGKPFKHHFITLFTTLFIAFIHGDLGRKHTQYSWFNGPLIHISQPICQFLKHSNLEIGDFSFRKEICHPMWENLNAQEIMERYDFYNSAENQITDEQKTIYIQKNLLSAGIRIRVDGVFGPNTEKYCQQWLQAQGIKLNGREDLDQYYFLFKHHLD